MNYKKKIRFLLMTLLIAIPGSAFAGEDARSFSDKTAILNFEIEGISLSTPIKNVAGIMTKQGWTQIGGAPTAPGVETVLFVKGSDAISMKYAISRAGEQGYLFLFKKNNDRTGGDGFTIEMRLRKLPPANYKSFQTPTPTETVHKYAAALKKMVCNGIENKDEQWKVCPPDSSEEILLGSKRPNFGKVTGIALQPFEVPGSLGVGIFSSSNDATIYLMHQNYKK